MTNHTLRPSSRWRDQLLNCYQKLTKVLDQSGSALTDVEIEKIKSLSPIIPHMFVRSQISDPGLALFVNQNFYPLGLSGDEKEPDYHNYPEYLLPITPSIAEIFDFKIYNDQTQPWSSKRNLARLVEVLGLLIQGGLHPWGPSPRLVELLLEVDDDQYLIEWPCFDRAEHKLLAKMIEKKYSRDFQSRLSAKKKNQRRAAMSP